MSMHQNTCQRRLNTETSFTSTNSFKEWRGLGMFHRPTSELQHLRSLNKLASSSLPKTIQWLTAKTLASWLFSAHDTKLQPNRWCGCGWGVLLFYELYIFKAFSIIMPKSARTRNGDPRQCSRSGKTNFETTWLTSSPKSISRNVFW